MHPKSEEEENESFKKVMEGYCTIKNLQITHKNFQTFCETCSLGPGIQTMRIVKQIVIIYMMLL